MRTTRIILQSLPALPLLFALICQLCVPYTEASERTASGNPAPLSSREPALAQSTGKSNGSARRLAAASGADLAITLSPSSLTVNEGDPATYTVTVTNNGPDIATNTVVTVTFSQSIYIDTMTPSQGTCNHQWNNATCDLGTLAAGATTTITLDTTVLEPGVLTNTVTTGSAAPDPNPLNNTATQVTTSNPVDQLVISKFHDDPFYAGSTGTFTITVINWGPETPSVITVTDVLPSRLTFVSGSGTNWTCGASGQTVTCIFTGQLPPEGGTEFTLLTGVTPGRSTVVTNTAIVTSTFADRDPSDNTAEDPVTIIGQEGIVTGTVFNDINGNGSHDAGEPYLSGTGVVITDSTGIPQTVTTNANGVYSATVAAGTTSVDIANNTLPPGSRLTTANDPQTVNVANGSTTAAPPVGYQLPADLSLTKTVNPPTANVGQIVTFTVSLTNSGPNVATNVTVRDTLPAGLSLVSASASVGSYNASTGIWTVGTLAANSSASLTVQARLTTSNPATNTAQVASSDQPDPDSTPNNNAPNEDDQASVTVSSQVADLSLGSTVSSSEPNVGDTITFTVTIHNAGPNSATNVAVLDQLTGGTFRSAPVSQGLFDPATGVWQVGTLPAGASATLQITVLVSSTDHITNTAQVTASDQYDPNSVPNNNNSSENDQTSITVTPLPGAAPPPSVPEPGTFALLGSGLAALAAYIRKRKQAHG